MELTYLITFLITLISCILSGIAGGGAGYITAPYWLIIGMTPAQGATTGSFMGIGMSVGSLTAFRKAEHYPRNKKLIIGITILTGIFSIMGALVLSHIDIDSFKNILAIITILSIPTIFIKRRSIKLRKSHQIISVALFIIILFASSIITSSVFSILITLGLVQIFNLTIIESTAMRRLIGAVQSVIIFTILAWQGNFIVLHAISGIVGGTIGSYLGTRFAIKKGEEFAKYALAVGALVGAIALIW